MVRNWSKQNRIDIIVVKRFVNAHKTIASVDSDSDTVDKAKNTNIWSQLLDLIVRNDAIGIKRRTHDLTNEYNEDYENLTIFMDMAKTSCVLKDFNDQ